MNGLGMSFMRAHCFHHLFTAILCHPSHNWFKLIPSDRLNHAAQICYLSVYLFVSQFLNFNVF